jgi:hypothetical protein
VRRRIPSLAVAAGIWALAFGGGVVFGEGPPETVHVTYHVPEGKLDEFLAVLKQHFPACRKDGLVHAEPHLILSGKEDGGKPVVIEILTWNDGDAPDSVPEHHPAVKKIWDGLNNLTEKRGGKPGIEIEEMDLVATPSRAPGR